MFALARDWDTLSDSDRQPLRDMVKRLVGYECKIAAQPNDDVIDLYIWSVAKRRITDWIEMKPSGAVGVIYDEYRDPEAPAVERLEAACDAYNDEMGVEFDTDSEGETESISSQDIIGEQQTRRDTAE